MRQLISVSSGDLSVDPATNEALFDRLRDTVYFVKDLEGRYQSCNSTLIERCGLRSRRELIGRTAAEVFRRPFGERYVQQDRHVLSTGEPLTDCLELHLYPDRDPGWCVTNKLPLRNAQNLIVGLVGVSQDLRLPDYQSRDYDHLADALRFAESHLSRRLGLNELAARAGLSAYQFDRRVRRIFGMSAGQWLIKLRIDFAERRLRESSDSVSTIALDAGYADQSAFARQFRRSTGLTPREYRETMQTARPAI